MNEKEWSEWSYDCKDASGQFLDGPGWIKKLTLTADGLTTTSVAFYDGHNANGTHKTTLQVGPKVTIDVEFEIPFKVEQGFYAEISASVECVNVQYKKAKP